MNEPIDSRQLRAFSTLARTGSFTLAAKELFLSQSAVSHSMRALEEDIGCRLFDRVGKKVFLTQAGEQLLHHSEKILKEMGTARASIFQLGKWGQGRLRIGASTTACQHILPRVLRELKSEFPQTSVMLLPGDTSEVIEAVRSNRIDLALVLESQSEDSFDFLRLFTDELQFIVGPSHPWVAQRQVIQAEISRQQFIIYNQASLTFRAVEQYFRKEDIVVNAVMELGNMEAIKELVKLGLGVSVMAPWVAQQEIEEGTLVALPLGRRKLRREWGIFHWKERRLNLTEERFVTLCRKAGEQLMQAESERQRGPAQAG